jgi:hypothetical protein
MSRTSPCTDARSRGRTRRRAGRNSAPTSGLAAARPLGRQCRSGMADAPSPSGRAWTPDAPMISALPNTEQTTKQTTGQTTALTLTCAGAARRRARPPSRRPRCRGPAPSAARTPGIRAGPGRSSRSLWPPPPAPGPGRNPRSGRTDRGRRTGRRQPTATVRARRAPSSRTPRPAARVGWRCFLWLLSPARPLDIDRRAVHRGLTSFSSPRRAGPA